MKNYNVIMLYSEDAKQLLMCRRRKAPYKGLSNLIGGKIEQGEAGFDAAYRELYEEAHVLKEDVTLFHVMDCVYYLSECKVEVYAGRLKQAVDVYGDENELYWADLNENFFDMALFAGEGNIGHMVEQVKMHAEKILGGISREQCSD